MIFGEKKGVTLIELLIVVAIIGILAAVAIPKYGELLEKANLGATMGNLGALRSAYSIYFGTYLENPKSIDPKQDPQFAKVLSGDVPFVKARYPDPNGPNSPYGNQVTVSTVKGAIPSTMGQGWFYDNADGYIYVNSIANDIKGIPYTSY
jgi:prepilin-type N-terminal cleavage/methylation domain-containing protein